MFDRIVERYDLLNRVLSFGQDVYWRRKMAQFAFSHSKMLILDLATGTGDSAKPLLIKGARVMGVDISFRMLRIAKKKIKGAFIPLSASAYQLPFRNKFFDAVTCAFGIRNMHDTEQVLKEIHRVIKVGGKIIILEFSLPKGFVRAPYLFYLKKIVPFVSSFLSARYAYEYLGSSIESFYPPEEFITLLKNCGFNKIVSKPLSLGCVYLYSGEKVDD